jgi:hypothetical protein
MKVWCFTRDESGLLEAGGQVQASNRCKPRSLRAGAEDKNPLGSGHYGILSIVPRGLNRNGFLCRKCQELGDKGLRFSPDPAVEKWPLRGSPATSRQRHWTTRLR